MPRVLLVIMACGDHDRVEIVVAKLSSVFALSECVVPEYGSVGVPFADCRNIGCDSFLGVRPDL